jgi:hypothetical protein
MLLSRRSGCVGIAVLTTGYLILSKEKTKRAEHASKEEKIRQAALQDLHKPVEQMNLKEATTSLKLYGGTGTRLNRRLATVGQTKDSLEKARRVATYTSCWDAEVYPPVGGISAMKRCQSLRRRVFGLLEESRSQNNAPK